MARQASAVTLPIDPQILLGPYYRAHGIGGRGDWSVAGRIGEEEVHGEDYIVELMYLSPSTIVESKEKNTMKQFK